MRRILVSGGSTTFDALATSDAVSWPWQLEQALAAGRSGVEVWNAGMPTWTSLENVISLAVRDVDLEPDVAVLFQAINDLQPASAAAFDPQYEEHARMTRRALGFDLEPLPWHRRLLLVEAVRGLLPVEAAPVHSPLPDPEPRRSERLPAEAVATFERNVRSFIALARGHGAEVLLVTQPIRLRTGRVDEDAAYLEQSIPGPSGRSAAVEVERLNAVLREVAREEDVALADAAREIGWRDEDFGDPVHHTRAGAEKLVRFLAPRIDALAAR